MSSRSLVLGLALLSVAACTVQPDPNSPSVVHPGGGSGGGAPKGGAGGIASMPGDGGPSSDAPTGGTVPPSNCDGGASSGSRPIGAVCGCGADCASGFCADGVCCNTACTGACVSCALPGSMG